jgi:LuxR family maltose regulon positive regulatory protein
LHSFTSASAIHDAFPGDSASVLFDPLTPQERRVLQLLAEGASNQDIAKAFVISHATARKHVSNILSKLGAANRTQAIARAREYALL